MSIKTFERKVCDINGSAIPAGFDLSIKIEGTGSAAEFSHVFEHVSPKAARQIRTKLLNMIKAANDEIAGGTTVPAASEAEPAEEQADPAPVDGAAAAGEQPQA